MIHHLLQLGAILFGAAIVGWMVRRRIRGGIVFLFALVAVAATYPLAFASTKLMLDTGGATDANIFLWNFWWVKKALLELHVNPYFTDFLFYPHGTTLALHSMALPYALASIPFQLIWPGVQGLTIATNAAILFSFWLAGYATYLLAHELVKDRTAAIAAGLAFSLCNFHFANTVRLHAMSIEWIPLFAFFVLRQHGTKRLRDGTLAGVVFACVFYSSIEYAYFLVLWLAILLFCNAVSERRLLIERFRACLPGAAAAVLVFLVASVPFWQAFARDRQQEQRTLSAEEVDATSADLVDFFLPNARHPLYRDRVSAYLRKIHEDDDGLGLGNSYIVLILALTGAIASLYRRQASMYVWIGCTLMFAVMALGVWLSIDGRNSGVLLPFAWLRGRLPFLEHLQMPIRFVAMVQFSACILFAYGFVQLRNFMTDRNRSAAGYIVVSILLFETLSVPMVMQEVQMPPSYRELGRSGAAGTLIDWPPGRGESLMCEVFHQTAHGHRLVQDVSAFLPRVSAEARAEAVGPEFVQLRMSILNGEMLGRLAEAQRGDVIRENIATLKRLDVRTIVLRRKEMNPEWLASAGENILRHVSAKVSEYDDAVVFELPFRIDE